ncbi:HAMP domain-containing protein [Roseospira navarrensis]|uniref:HAMP domain-containing protein n=1 Tax=Roseospira navarrensis TaxID=140058 RepID=A0A7X2D313_9PROT|nr:HAMP domain-containing protein [Roseospira navarrensis]
MAHKIGAIVGVLGLGLIAEASLNGYQAWQALQAQRHVETTNQAAQALIDAAESLAWERGASARVIRQPDGPVEDSIERARAARAEAMAHLQAGLETLERLDHETLHDDMDAVTARLEPIALHRAELDRVFETRSIDSFSALDDEWVPAMNALTMAVADLTLALEGLLPEIVSPRLLSLYELRTDMWRVSEYADRQKILLARVIGEKGLLTRDLQATNFGFDGVMDNAWTSALRRSERLSGDLAAAVDTARAVFTGAYADTRGSVYAAASSFGAYPVEAAEWIAVANETIAAVQTAGAAIAAGADQEITAEIDAALGKLWFDLGMVAFAVVVLAGAAVFAHVAVARPLIRTTGEMHALAEGDMDIAISGQERRDEIGLLAKALLHFQAGARERQAMRAEQAATEERNAAARREALQKMADTIDTSSREALAAVGRLAESLTQDAENLKASSDRVSDNATTVAGATQQALANAQTVASAAEQLAASIQEIGRQVAESTAIANTTVERARETQSVVAQLSEVGDSIGEVVGLIGEIADQTNLLALNATIEAARAGDAGKGFAVVASEVKSLAQQTASSTADIQKRVAQIQAVSRQAAEAINGVGSTIEQMNAITQTVSAAVEQQMGATHEIAQNVQESTDATREVARLIGTVADEANSAKASADTVEDTSRTLNEAVLEFGTTVTRLVRTSTADTDRRRHERFELAVHVATDAGGRGENAVLLDISRSGARLQSLAGAQVGGHLTIDVPSTPYRWPGRIVDVSPKGVHIEFDEEHEINVPALQRLSSIA